MTKDEFLRVYRQPRVTIWFDDNTFASDNQVSLAEELVGSVSIMDFYVLRSSKNGALDQRGITQRIGDTSSALITVREAVENPAKWDLSLDGRTLPALNSISRIPIATDSRSGKTLILDSNHCIVNLIKQNPSDFTVPLVRVSGKNLEKIIVDFQILNRQ